METGLFEIQADHLSGFRQARQTPPASRDVVYAQFGRADPDRLDHVPGLQGMTNETEAAPGSIPKFILDSGAKCNRAKQTGFARLCQAL